jgi:hypothetical protein
MKPHTPDQVAVEPLLEACRKATDPLQIVNAFVKCPLGIGPPNEYWTKRLCIVAEHLAERNNQERIIPDE